MTHDVKFTKIERDMCFRLSIWPNGHRESHKHEFVKSIQATGLIILSLNSAQNFFFLFRVADSVLEEHELVVQSWYPRR
jgi:hypothetical protein